MAPVIKYLNTQRDFFSVSICVTAQHREMLDQVMKIFNLTADYDLNIMRENQDLFQLSGDILKHIQGVFTDADPDIILVQGDTTTALFSALAGFYLKIPVGHIEAGLRTHDPYNPFPEEINRRMLSVVAEWHFAPTDAARNNLLREGIPGERIHVTGNTIVDALQQILQGINKKSEEEFDRFFRDRFHLTFKGDSKKTIVVTAHRREHFGSGLEQICLALKEIAQLGDHLQIVFPVHPNPNVKEKVAAYLSGIPNIFLISPLAYEPFVYLMSRSYLIMTDSGGIQEEAPALGKPVILVREKTERPEGIAHGVVKLTGTAREDIVSDTVFLISDSDAYEKMSGESQLYGDGTAGMQIGEILKRSV